MLKIDLKALVVLLFLIGLMVFMFILGRNSVKITTTTKIDYLPGDTITNVILEPVPAKETSYADIDTLGILKYCIDNKLFTHLIPVIEKEKIIYKDVDTSSILNDWVKLREYDLTLFSNDTVGTVKTKTKVQFNKLKSLDYTFIPINKVTTVTQEKKTKFDLTLNLGLTTNSDIVVNPNIYFDNGIGFGLLYLNNFNNETNNLGLTVGYKF